MAAIRNLLALVFLPGVLLVAAPASAAKPKTIARVHLSSASLGAPNHGHLLNGVRLDDAPYLRVLPAHAHEDVRWGLPELVTLVQRAAKSVARQQPGSVLTFGHLSQRGGGEINMHASHESGRDIDLAFYVKDARGGSLAGEHFVPFTGDGTAKAWPGAHFDDARNWALVAALVGDPQIRISHIFVSNPIRARLLAYAARIGASQELRGRAVDLLAQPHGSLPHDDHFHVRIACPAGMKGCVEQPEVHRVVARRGAAKKRAHPAQHPQSHAPAKVVPKTPVKGTEKSTEKAVDKKAPPPPGPFAKEVEPTRPASEDTEADDPMPRFTPSVPGLDSVVVPAPLIGD